MRSPGATLARGTPLTPAATAEHDGSVAHRRASTVVRRWIAVSIVLSATLTSACNQIHVRAVVPPLATTTSQPALRQQTDQALSGVELERLVVAPPGPFAQLPDTTLRTGLMEVGNPSSGKIGIGFSNQQEIVAAGFQRGWEKAYVSPDGAAADINVFEFRSPDGPSRLVREFAAERPAGFVRFAITTVPDAQGLAGRSPEGKPTAAIAFGDARFLVVIVIGGPAGAHDYRGLALTLANEQHSRLQGA